MNFVYQQQTILQPVRYLRGNGLRIPKTQKSMIAFRQMLHQSIELYHMKQQ